MIIRKAVETDAYHTALLNINSWKEAYVGLVPDELLANRNMSEKTVNKFKEFIADDNLIFLVAEDNGKILGFVWGGKARAENPPFENELYALYVLSEYYGRGVASELVKAFKESINDKQFFLFTLFGNVRAAKFYEKQGGKIRHDRECYNEFSGYKLHEVMYVFE